MLHSMLARLSGSAQPAECWQLVKHGATLVDVRSPAEFAQGHLPQALNIPLDTLEQWQSAQVDKAAPLVLYCGAGIRAQKGCDILRAKGFSAVINGGAIKDLLAGA
ncbi:rhodanese-like domain-containing protein [Shewanella litorisediminis]|uniref:Rhodanese-like domain-containing protein n=1 Tax=Shewanella litorisediminis TaxID=1173586 RepID=A0ABX7G2X0_9GAMM|nr:rhodanese-like domain-containing protein [Shewanella litorisediminis]MCL2917131.1 rhodanese-like domain-containing protein [Shewanella litorisediminis]QRH01608.1 rhodanese-like domain-containing protein [Shewanella litorisediminis]